MSEADDADSPMASAALSVLGYAGFGFLARCYALGIQKRNIMDSMFLVCWG